MASPRSGPGAAPRIVARGQGRVVSGTCPGGAALPAPAWSAAPPIDSGVAVSSVAGGGVVGGGLVVVGATEVDVSDGSVAGGAVGADVDAVVEAGPDPAPGLAGVVAGGVGVAPLGGAIGGPGGFTAGDCCTASWMASAVPSLSPTDPVRVAATTFRTMWPP